MSDQKMNPEIKARWLAALRSGEYTQGADMLRTPDGAYCCLGVLCDLSGKAEWRQKNGANYYMDRDGMPPDAVWEWAGFSKEGLGYYPTPRVEIDGATKPIDQHNDNGRTFAEIADAIEGQL